MQLAAWCEQFSPIVGLEDTDNLAFDITGLGPLFGGEQSLLEQVVRATQQQGFDWQLGIADTLGAAWAMAHFGACRTIVQPGETATALAELPIAALRLDEIEILTELGIERIGQLLTLPRDALASRFDALVLIASIKPRAGCRADRVAPSAAGNCRRNAIGISDR